MDVGHTRSNGNGWLDLFTGSIVLSVLYGGTLLALRHFLL
jgi:hypothetical protein